MRSSHSFPGARFAFSRPRRAREDQPSPPPTPAGCCYTEKYTEKYSTYTCTTLTSRLDRGAVARINRGRKHTHTLHHHLHHHEVPEIFWSSFRTPSWRLSSHDPSTPAREGWQAAAPPTRLCMHFFFLQHGYRKHRKCQCLIQGRCRAHRSPPPLPLSLSVPCILPFPSCAFSLPRVRPGADAQATARVDTRP